MVDVGVLALAAVRRRLVREVAAAKLGSGRGLRDDGREARVRVRGAWVARLLGLPQDTASGLLDQLIADARCLQGIGIDVGHGASAVPGANLLPPPRVAGVHPETGMIQGYEPLLPASYAWLRLIPPPARWASLLRHVPDRVQHDMLECAMSHALAALEPDGGLEVLEGRQVGIEVADLGLRWVVTRQEGVMRVRAGSPVAQATVRGSVTDLLLLAARLEDADTLFFQRRLVLTGDTELGLTARNLLDRLPWEQVPLALRITINRVARLARAARAAARPPQP